MKRFKFEITITEDDVSGDEFWEDAIENDSTGITNITEAIIQAIEESNLIIGSDQEVKDIVKLISFEDN